jgi:MoaA/NifB/PqqE/SkfB family radical SAM enzyme
MVELTGNKKISYQLDYKRLSLNLLHFNRTSLKNTIFLLRLLWEQRKAQGIREKSKTNGLHVPAVIFFSITKSCNLNCKGCYQKAQKRTAEKEMSTEKIISVLKEGAQLGSSIVGLLGGEPFIRKDLFTITSSLKNMLFLVFTNGLLIDKEMIRMLKKNKNIIPLLSNEGYECQTDTRRGAGVYNAIRNLAETLKKNHVIFGVSITATSENFDVVNDETFIRDLIKSGCTAFFYMDYRPVDEVSNHLRLNSEQMQVLEDNIDTFRTKYKAQYFSPASEKRFGGCLGAGKGWIHINYDGSVEPCPFAPFSDINLHNATLKEALDSDFLRKVRENHEQLEQNNNGGCTLWENREWLNSLRTEEETARVS